MLLKPALSDLYTGRVGWYSWFGQHEQDTKDAFECARYMHKHAPPQDSLESLAQLRATPCSIAEIESSSEYSTRLTYLPWLRRAWTFQEVVSNSYNDRDGN